MAKAQYVVAGVIAAMSMVGCGSSSTKSSTSTSTASQPAATSTTASSAASSGQPLPAPCTLLTKDDVASLFGTTALDATPSQGPATGTAQCSFGLTVGSQGKTVSIRTRTDYANDPGFLFPQDGKKVPGIGDLAIITSPQLHSGRITVQLGKNVVEINVEFYDQPVSETFLTQLAKAAVARV
ncbi:MAG: hypothetical protein JWL83_1207 [Actinomycetia bacterium]|nr:hypothetical protein [Actinomycetes bacterium]